VALWRINSISFDPKLSFGRVAKKNSKALKKLKREYTVLNNMVHCRPQDVAPKFHNRSISTQSPKSDRRKSFWPFSGLPDTQIQQIVSSPQFYMTVSPPTFWTSLAAEFRKNCFIASFLYGRSPPSFFVGGELAL
jgi:hypothetical protein